MIAKERNIFDSLTEEGLMEIEVYGYETIEKKSYACRHNFKSVSVSEPEREENKNYQNGKITNIIF